MLFSRKILSGYTYKVLGKLEIQEEFQQGFVYGQRMERSGYTRDSFLGMKREHQICRMHKS